MLFNSFIFWVFLFVVLAIYTRLPHKFQNRFLLLASYVFYGYWDYRFLSLIAISTAVDYVLSRKIFESDNQSLRKYLVTVSIFVNIGFLAVFKYYSFFAYELNLALLQIGLHDYLPIWQIILPVGISFYTFQTLSYTIDVYKGRTEPARDPLDFALYVSFFPQLVAGPIERPQNLLPQITNPRSVSRSDIRIGIYLILFGLFKKVIIADNMAPIVNAVFDGEGVSSSGTDVLLGVYAFAFQIYGDFSGYSTIAMGVAKLLGIDLMWNFKMPYLSRSPSEFWSRWHISLSSWLRDYLYVPLGGNRGGNSKTFRNLMLTMMLGGLWHGANWTFIVWGIFHGAILIVYRIIPGLGGTGPRMDRKHLVLDLARCIAMFQLICISWLFFRAESVSHAIELLSLVFHNQNSTDLSTFAAFSMFIFVVPMFLYEIWLEWRDNQLAILEVWWPIQAAVFSYLAIMLIVFVPAEPQIFIYFQF